MGIIAAAVGALATAGAGLVTGQITGALFFSTFLKTFVANAVLGGLQSLGSKSNPGGDTTTDRSQAFRQPISSRRLIYGEVKVGGPIVYLHVSDEEDNKNEWLTLFIAHAAHECEDIVQYYIDDKAVNVSSNRVTTDEFKKDDKSYAYLYERLGTSTQTALSIAVSNTGGQITSNHRLRGICYTCARLRWNSEIWFGGVPNISAVIKGNNQIEDTRSSTTAYSANPAMILRNFLMDSTYGLNAASTEIDDTTFEAAATVCDESVSLDAGGTETRYTCNLVIDSADRVEDNINKILSTMNGKLVYTGGVFKLYAGAYTVPTITLDENDLIGPIRVLPRASRDSIYNKVKGVFIDPDNNYQATDFPAIASSSAATEDGEVKIRDIDLPGTNSHTMAQRIAQIELNKARKQMILELQCSLKQAYQLTAGDTVMVDFDRWGWSGTTWEVAEWKLDIKETDGPPIPIVLLRLRETASSVYTWTPATDEQEMEAEPTTTLGDPFTVETPSISVQSGTNHLLLKGDGTVMTRMKIAWTEPSNFVVRSEGKADIEYKKSTETLYQKKTVTLSSDNFIYVNDVQEGDIYDVRVKFRNYFGNASEYATATHTVVGKTALPSNVSRFIASQTSSFATFTWTAVSDADLSGYEIRYGPRNNVVWENGTPLTVATKATTTTTANIPPGEWSFLIKAVDTTGNYSQLAKQADLDLQNRFNIISEIELTDSSGTGTDIVRHYTGVLTPDSNSLASDADWEIFDQFVYDPTTSGTWTLEEQDLGFDDRVRVWGTIDSELGPGETSGTADPSFELAWRTEAQSGTAGGSAQQQVLTNDVTVTNMIKHYTGVYTPDSQSLASDADWEIFDEAVYDPYISCSLETAEFDLGADTVFDIAADIIAIPAASASGTINPNFQLDYHTAAGSYDGYENWVDGRIEARYVKGKVTFDTGNGIPRLSSIIFNTDSFQAWVIGDITCRYLTGRLNLDATNGVSKITGYKIGIDIEDHTESDTAVSVSASGTTVNFDKQFHAIPNLTVTLAEDSSKKPVVYDVTTSGFSIKTYNDSGTAVTGLINWRATII